MILQSGDLVMKLSSTELKVLEILNMFGPLRLEQVIALVDVSLIKKETEKALKSLLAMHLVYKISSGYYIGLNAKDKVNQSVIESVWVLLYFISSVTEFKRGEYPSQIAFKKAGLNYTILRVKRGYEFLISVYLENRADERLILIIDDESDISRIEPFLNDSLCVFATLEFAGKTIPQITFLLGKEADA